MCHASSFAIILACLIHSMMDRLRLEAVEQHCPTMLQEQPSTLTNTVHDNYDDAFANSSMLDDHQAHIHRRAPTRHSIKSLTGRKTVSKQNSVKEVSHWFS